MYNLTRFKEDLKEVMPVLVGQTLICLFIYYLPYISLFIVYLITNQ